MPADKIGVYAVSKLQGSVHTQLRFQQVRWLRPAGSGGHAIRADADEGSKLELGRGPESVPSVTLSYRRGAGSCLCWCGITDEVVWSLNRKGCGSGDADLSLIHCGNRGSQASVQLTGADLSFLAAGGHKRQVSTGQC